MRRSSRMRILGWVLLPVLVVLTVSWFAAAALLLDRVDQRIDTELASELSELRVLAEEGIDPETGQPFGDVQRLMQLHLERNIPNVNETMFYLVDAEVQARSAQDPPARLDQNEALLAQVRDIDEVTVSGVSSEVGDVKFAAIPVVQGGQKGTFVVAVFSDLEGREVAQVMSRLAAVSLLALAAAAVIGWFVAGRVLRPVRDIQQTAQTITLTDLSQRIPVSDSAGDDLEDLSRTFNDMLDRLEGAYTARKEFIDDAGHELRTPLTIARGHLELLEDDPEAREQTVSLVLDELARMSRIVHDLQTLTKSDLPDFLAVAEADIAALTDELFVKASALGDRNWRQMARADVNAPLDRQRITQAVMQLAANAVRHTREGDSVGIGSYVTDGRLLFVVDDSGPGIPFDDREVVFDRFRKGSKPGDDGVGLGLAIVRAIAEAHGGRAYAEGSSLGGARMCVDLPLTVWLEDRT